MFRLYLVAALVALIASTAAAVAGSWVVERVTRDVTVSKDGSSWRAIDVGDAIPNTFWVRTGPRDRVLLSNGSERILYRANTLAAISVSQPSGAKTRVAQRRGSLLLTLSSRRGRETSVVTPHLAAVVKGTIFAVSVDGGVSQVRVDRGVVSVSDGDRAVDVAEGRQATVSARGGGVVVETASETSVVSSSTGSRRVGQGSGAPVGEGVGETLGDTVGGVGETVGETLGGVTDTVEDTVGGVTETVEDAVGGLLGDG